MEALNWQNPQAAEIALARVRALGPIASGNPEAPPPDVFRYRPKNSANDATIRLHRLSPDQRDPKRPSAETSELFFLLKTGR
jgi:hypothetical protein